jgi:hypothetical protein
MDLSIPAQTQIDSIITALNSNPDLAELNISWTGGIYRGEDGHFWISTTDATSMPYRGWTDGENFFETMREVIDFEQVGYDFDKLED